MKTLGIIGGLGPETTAEFYLQIMYSCQQLYTEHRPSTLISSVPIPYTWEQEAIGNNLGMERIRPILISEAQRLKKAGADFLVMPCNSLHIFIDDIRNSVTIPVLSIVEETLRFIKKNVFKNIAIISTLSTVQNHLYESSFDHHGIHFTSPDPYEQARIGKIILDLVHGRRSNYDRETMMTIIEGFAQKDVDAVILACTDLQLLLPNHASVPIFDTMKILGDATVRYMGNI